MVYKILYLLFLGAFFGVICADEVALKALKNKYDKLNLEHKTQSETCDKIYDIAMQEYKDLTLCVNILENNCLCYEPTWDEKTL